jgi:hypothetical protein
MIQDVYPESGYFPSRIQREENTGSRIRIRKTAQSGSRKAKSMQIRIHNTAYKIILETF